MSIAGAPLPEIDGDGAAPWESAPREPVVLRGLVRDWPLVGAARTSAEAAREHLLAHDGKRSLAVSIGPPEIDGRLFYNADFTATNCEQVRATLPEVLTRIFTHLDDPRPPLIYVASTTIDAAAPALAAANPPPERLPQALASIWIGNRSRIAAHQDAPDNLACVAVGRRRFTLFPPEQLENLYIGPLDITPAGQPVSLVDFAAPDLARFPRFVEAARHARTAELAPGDAIYIPSLWWHHIESLEPFNVLINYWWRRAPAELGAPFGALIHTIFAIRDLPPEERTLWRDIFQHYVFGDRDAVCAHIPPSARGVLGPIDAAQAQRMRTFLLHRLNR